jgi:hypothetical protein
VAQTAASVDVAEAFRWMTLVAAAGKAEVQPAFPCPAARAVGFGNNVAGALPQSRPPVSTQPARDAPVASTDADERGPVGLVLRITTFASHRGTLSCERLNQRSARRLLILVRFLNLKFL